MAKRFLDRILNRSDASGAGGNGGSDFPPAPAWRPTFSTPLDAIAERMSYYLNGQRDFALLKHGTAVVLEPEHLDEEAVAYASGAIRDFLKAHPDMTPTPMDDGNLLVRYGPPAVNVVLAELAREHWDEIEAHHLDGLTADEVLITPLGSNKFDDVGKMALLGRSWAFMDAMTPNVVRIVRSG